MASLAEIRAKLKAQDEKNSGNFASGDNANYAFWNIPTGGSSTVRFLPDANQDNTFFWVEKQILKIPFPGIKGHNENKEVLVQVPCVEMWDGIGSCPVISEVRPWWNDDSLKPLASKYWIKRSWIFQGFVVKDGLSDDNAPENPIRRFTINKSIFDIIKAALMDPDFENLPTDYVNGTDFVINKGQKGEYADYGTSNWSRKDSSLSEEQLSAIEEHGLKDLADSLPKKPTPEQLNTIYEMFEASVAGELYDPARWAKDYRPYGFEYDSGKTASPKVSMKPAPKEASTPAPEEASTPEPEASSPAPADESTAGKSVDEILAKIRNRT